VAADIFSLSEKYSPLKLWEADTPTLTLVFAVLYATEITIPELRLFGGPRENPN
jgi:hypothetical protein